MIYREGNNTPEVSKSIEGCSHVFHSPKKTTMTTTKNPQVHVLFMGSWSLHKIHTHLHSILIPVLQAYATLNLCVGPLAEQLLGQFVQICQRRAMRRGKKIYIYMTFALSKELQDKGAECQCKHFLGSQAQTLATVNLNRPKSNFQSNHWGEWPFPKIIPVKAPVKLSVALVLLFFFLRMGCSAMVTGLLASMATNNKKRKEMNKTIAFISAFVCGVPKQGKDKIKHHFHKLAGWLEWEATCGGLGIASRFLNRETDNLQAISSWARRKRVALRRQEGRRRKM